MLKVVALVDRVGYMAPKITWSNRMKYNWNNNFKRLIIKLVLHMYMNNRFTMVNKRNIQMLKIVYQLIRYSKSELLEIWQNKSSCLIHLASLDLWLVQVQPILQCILNNSFFFNSRTCLMLAVIYKFQLSPKLRAQLKTTRKQGAMEVTVVFSVLCSTF